ncbi:pyridoxamine 5'-phosphate oxidase family protein [Streptomyces sp. Ru62]|uniref:pyridoxamine 5'-phosphate oxidase family protein n=1 Tax=Streptomyces sp. Ru62 TaxID=2080745 RepID=UPI0015E3BFEB|nr:pyridoxamine 5'-phosphate oxidase family protein [Streptomyces sp. Ru62]
MKPLDVPSAGSVREELAESWGAPLDRVRAKLSPVLHPWLREFIALSPYVVLATADGRGRCDASPRGGAPGFVRVLDERTLFIPEESGNRLLQTLGNLAESPGVGLLFLIPGMRETARVNGRAEPVSRSDPRWADLPLDDEERERLLWGSLVHVEEAYYHCGRASRFADLWNTARIDRNQSDPPLAKRPATTAGGEKHVRHSGPVHGLLGG